MSQHLATNELPFLNTRNVFVFIALAQKVNKLLLFPANIYVDSVS